MTHFNDNFQEEQYAKWMAACRLASKGRSLADSSYDSEVASIKSFLSMQKPAHGPVVSINPDSIDASDFLSPRVYKKLKGKVKLIVALISFIYLFTICIFFRCNIGFFSLIVFVFFFSKIGNTSHP